jgi:hypothetical protein
VDGHIDIWDRPGMGVQLIPEAAKPHVLGEIARDRCVSVAQVAINWLIQRPGVSSVIIGARTEEQLIDNLGAAQWQLTGDEVARLDRESARPFLTPTGTSRSSTRPACATRFRGRASGDSAVIQEPHLRESRSRVSATGKVRVTVGKATVCMITATYLGDANRKSSVSPGRKLTVRT